MDFDRRKYSVWTQTPVNPNVDNTKFENADTDAETDVGTVIK